MTDEDLERALRDDIAAVLIRYATGIDGRDWGSFRDCFTDDCEADYGEIGTWHGADEITEWMKQSHEPCGHTLHRITNIAVDPDGEDRARARCYVDAVVMGLEGSGGAHAIGFYEDDLVRTATGWHIAQRRYTMVHLEPVRERIGL